MAMMGYNAGLDSLSGWATGTFKWMAVSAGTFDPDLATVAAVVAASTEISVTGYTRPAVAGATRTVDNATNRINYGATDPSWSGLGAGQTITAIDVFRFVTNDADSIPIGRWELVTPVATDATDPLAFVLTDGLVAYLDAA